MSKFFKIVKIKLQLQKSSFALLVLAVSFIAGLQNIYAQNSEIKFEQLSIKQGLSDNRVVAICQDSKGFMWFGTSNGLNRFDGYNFINYGHISLSDGATIYEDKRGSVWLTQSDNGELYRFDRISEKFIHYSNVGPTAHQVFEDRQGDVWIATWQNGLAKYIPEKDSFKIYNYNPEEKGKTGNNLVYSIFQDKNEVIWVAGINGLFVYDKVSDRFIQWNNKLTSECISFLEDKNGVLWVGTFDGLLKINESRTTFERFQNGTGEQNTVAYIYEDSKNRLWIGSEITISQFDRSTNKFTNYNYRDELNRSSSRPYFPIIEDKKGIIWTGIKIYLASFNEKAQNFKLYSYRSDSRVSLCSMYKDKSGAVWFGTAKDGVFMYDGLEKPFHNIWNKSLNSFLIKNNIEPSVLSVFKDESGILWIGKRDGFLRLDENNNSIKLYTHESNAPGSLSASGANSIAEESSDVLWLSALSTGLNRFNKITGKSQYFMHDPVKPESLYSNTVEDILIDKSGEIWINCGETLDKFNPADGSFTHYRDTLKNSWIIRIFEDRNQTLWVTTNKGIAYLNKASGTFKYIGDTSNESNRFIGTNSITFYEDKHANFWLSTGNGLDKLDRKSAIITHIQGNIPNRIIGILEDDKGTLWMLTAIGISTYNPVTGTIKNYDESDGVDLNAAFYTPYLKDKNGVMYFGGYNGLIKFHPDSIKDNPNIPTIVITSFKESNKDIQLDSTISVKKLIELPYSENNVSFEFAALNYSLPQKNQYAYQLEGIDKDWVYSGTRRFASYPNLQPGKYVFRVKGSNNDGVWNEKGTSISLIISPPLWKTWWAYLAYGLLFLVALFGLRRYEMNRLYFKDQVKLDAAVLKEKDETEKLKSRFFANISHEFRTPLTLILGPAEKIISGTSDDNKKDANVIKRNSRRLLQLINQLLDLSKLEAGKLRLEASKGNIVSFVKGVTLSFESLSESKDITLRLQSDKEYIELYFDKEKMMQVLTNILSNAFKFTPVDGKIFVSVKETDSKHVEIKIRDSGIGIAQEEIPKLFDRFYQVDSSQTREFEGTGIGLALTKELVELHRGTIRVESKQEVASEKGPGWTEFTVELPLGKEHLNDEEIVKVTGKVIDPNDLAQVESYLIPTPQSAYSATIKEELTDELPEDKTIILVVEDNYDMREYIKESMESNCHVEEAVNGEQGVRKAIKIIPDLIISDMMMPKMGGNELVRILKNEETTSHIPIILLTAKAAHEDKLDGLETGADDYLTKPFDIKELQVRVKNLINNRKKLQEKYSKFKSLKPENQEQKLNGIDEKFMLKVAKVIDEHLSEEEFDIEYFCNEVAMSRTQLHRKLKALTGKSASLYIRSVKLAKAKKMIEDREGNISEIAYSVGFSSPIYFSRCFKDEFGYPPSELKK